MAYRGTGDTARGQAIVTTHRLERRGEEARRNYPAFTHAVMVCAVPCAAAITVLAVLITVPPAVSASASTVQEQSPQTVRGTVTSVDGNQACGTSGITGHFSMSVGGATFTIEVNPATVFDEHHARTTFGAVCVGDKAKARGPISTNDVVAASLVIITPPTPQHVAGTVSTVNGSNAPGTCGSDGGSGSFVLASQPSAITVSVSPSTGFAQNGDHTPSFANVCVGDKAHVQGPISPSGTITASHVTVIPPPPEHVLGSVTSVNGSTAPDSCGMSTSGGFFVLMAHGMSVTVNVGPSATFAERRHPGVSFADICVGDKVRVIGTGAGAGTIDGDGVAIIPPPPRHVSGIVSTVNGSSASDVCGGSGSEDQFTVPKGVSVITVDVTPSTLFGDPSVATPTFAQVCVGSKVRVTGTGADGTLAATRVAVVPPQPTKVSGTVVSVDGTSAQGACGTGGNSGSFTVATPTTSQTVNVTPSTVFHENGVSIPTFQVLCVGDTAKASGTRLSVGQPIAATKVVVTNEQRQSGRR